MIQGIQGLQKSIGINPASAQPKPPVEEKKEKGPDIGALLSGKLAQGGERCEKMAQENSKKLDLVG